MALQEECGLGSTVSPRGIQGTPQSCAAPSFCTMWGLASAERVSRNQPAEVMQVQTGPEGGNSPLWLSLLLCNYMTLILTVI